MASSAWERRNAGARAKGYRNYYDYRTHDNGRIPPNQPGLQGAARTRARGKSGRAEFLALIRRHPEAYVLPVGQERWANGQWRRIHILVIMADGSERHFYLRSRPGQPNDPASAASLQALRDEMTAAGIYWVAAPSIDVFADADEPDLDDFGADLDEAA